MLDDPETIFPGEAAFSPSGSRGSAFRSHLQFIHHSSPHITFFTLHGHRALSLSLAGSLRIYERIPNVESASMRCVFEGIPRLHTARNDLYHPSLVWSTLRGLAQRYTNRD